jgi:hypothetical protein
LISTTVNVFKAFQLEGSDSVLAEASVAAPIDAGGKTKGAE